MREVRQNEFPEKQASALGFNLRNIRRLLIDGFGDAELRRLCFDEDDFRPVYEQLSTEMGKDRVIDKLIEYADRKELISELLALLKERNPARYRKHKPYRESVTEAVTNRLPFEPETSAIPAGRCQMSSSPHEDVEQSSGASPEVYLDEYAIGKTPVKNEEYARFVQEYHNRRPKGSSWSYIRPPRDKLDHPVVGITFFDACAYCIWLREQTGRSYRLPTEAEWDKAALITYLERVDDIFEWTCTAWGEDWREAQEIDCCRVETPDEVGMDTRTLRVCKGGPIHNEAPRLGSSERKRFPPNSRLPNLGFRVVEDLSGKRRIT